jgi:REP element-mobilizing transposase RayT
MPHQLFYHIVWTTRDRRPTITREVAGFLDRVLRAICRQERATILALGMVTTHVHLLVRAHTMTNIPRMLQRLKGGTSVLANRELELPIGRQLRWAQGYAIQTVSPRSLGPVRDYVLNQAGHHPHDAIPGWLPPPEPGDASGELGTDFPACLGEARG